MTLNYFKDVLFDIINDCYRFDIIDILADDKNNTFTIIFDDCEITIKCSQKSKKA